MASHSLFAETSKRCHISYTGSLKSWIKTSRYLYSGITTPSKQVLCEQQCQILLLVKYIFWCTLATVVSDSLCWPWENILSRKLFCGVGICFICILWVNFSMFTFSLYFYRLGPWMEWALPSMYLSSSSLMSTNFSSIVYPTQLKLLYFPNFPCQKLSKL